MRKLLLAVSILVFSLTVSSAENTPVMFTDMKAPVNEGEARPWSPPDYSDQEEALGYETGAFAVPVGMEQRVSFWIDIYSKYNTDQGLLHDSRYVHLVYEEVDFTDIMANEELSVQQKRKARAKRVKEMKADIRDRLKRLSRLSSPAGLEEKDLRYWYLFKKVEENNKFRQAMGKNRLRFQLGQQDRFIQGILFSGRYLKQMEQIFREQGMPIELTRLPFVESSFNLKARSRVGASGIWQFIRSSGKQLMRINASVDERNDPIKSTVAAAKFLATSYKMLENWPLAVTGYNHGPAGVRRMTKRYKTKSIAELVDARHGRFRFASANFYASFVAALEVEKRANKHFAKVLWLPPIGGKEIRLSRSIPSKFLLQWFEGGIEEAKLYNPHIRRHVWQGRGWIGRKNFVRVRDNVYAEAKSKMDSYRVASGRTVKAGQSYRIMSGETLSEIAENFGVSLSLLQDVNGISNPRRIRAGQKLVIPMK